MWKLPKKKHLSKEILDAQEAINNLKEFSNEINAGLDGHHFAPITDISKLALQSATQWHSSRMDVNPNFDTQGRPDYSALHGFIFYIQPCWTSIDDMSITATAEKDELWWVIASCQLQHFTIQEGTEVAEHDATNYTGGEPGTDEPEQRLAKQIAIFYDDQLIELTVPGYNDYSTFLWSGETKMAYPVQTEAVFPVVPGSHTIDCRIRCCYNQTETPLISWSNAGKIVVYNRIIQLIRLKA